MELVADYDLEIAYHPGKANVVGDALTRKRVGAAPGRSVQFAANGTILVHGRVCVPKDEELRREILSEVHASMFSIHPGATNMYRELKRYYQWVEMKRDVANSVVECDFCQLVKAEHQVPSGLL